MEAGRRAGPRRRVDHARRVPRRCREGSGGGRTHRGAVLTEAGRANGAAVRTPAGRGSCLAGSRCLHRLWPKGQGPSRSALAPAGRRGKGAHTKANPHRNPPVLPGHSQHSRTGAKQREFEAHHHALPAPHLRGGHRRQLAGRPRGRDDPRYRKQRSQPGAHGRWDDQPRRGVRLTHPNHTRAKNPSTAPVTPRLRPPGKEPDPRSATPFSPPARRLPIPQARGAPVPGRLVGSGATSGSWAEPGDLRARVSPAGVPRQPRRAGRSGRIPVRPEMGRGPGLPAGCGRQAASYMVMTTFPGTWPRS